MNDVTRPILFSAPMIRALLEGRKTQTRRAIKGFEQRDIAGAFRSWGLQRGKTFHLWPNLREQVLQFCPYGRPGDLLYVRETWGAIKVYDHLPPRKIPVGSPIAYKTDGPDSATGKWRVSIHMLRWASRLTLRLTDVRVERLQEIHWRDAIAEGLEWVAPTYGVKGVTPSWNSDPVQSYRALWESINGAGSWAANPFVWALTFQVIQQNVGEVINKPEVET